MGHNYCAESRMNLLLLFTLLSFTGFSQTDSIIAYYNDSTPRVMLFADGHRESYSDDGTLQEWGSSDRIISAQQQTAYRIQYYRSGNIQTKYFELKNGFIALVGYSDSPKEEITGGRMHHNKSIFTFEGNRLVTITSERKKIPIEVPYMPSEDPDEVSGNVKYVYEEDVVPMLPNAMRSSVRGSCKAKGNFKHFELYNGFIYYYNEQGELELTEKMVNGAIQYNPRIPFEEKELEQIVVGYFDRNFNGYAEKREVEKVTRFKLSIPNNKLESFKWSEVFLFNNLEGLIVNNRLYKMSDYSDATPLKQAIIDKKGSPIGSYIPVPNPLPPKRFEPKTTPEYVAFPDSLASFVGGEIAMKDWMKKNMIYPEESKEMGVQGRVFIQFMVLLDGSIREVKILKGVDKFLDREAKRMIRSMPNWNPAIHEGQKVNSIVRLPIRFVME